MVVTRDIPQPNDIIAQSQPQLLANNQGYVDTFAINHVAYNEVGAGKHKYCVYPVQAVAPATTSGEGATYTKDATLMTGRSDLFYKYQTSGGTSMTGLEFPLNICKAFGKATTAGNLIANTSFNVTSANFVLPNWTIIMTSPIVPAGQEARIMVLIGSQSTVNSNESTYTIDSPTQITITRGSGVTGISFWIMAL